MVLLDSVVEIVNSLLGGFVSLPSTLTQPIVSHIYVDIAFIAVFVLIILLSKFLALKRLVLALALTLTLAMLIGGAYFAVLAIAVQIFMVLVFKIVFRKKDDMGGGGDLGKMGGEDLGKIGGDDLGKIGGDELGSIGGGDLGKMGGDELSLPKAEEFKEPGMPELTPGAPEIEKPKQKLCP